MFAVKNVLHNCYLMDPRTNSPKTFESEEEALSFLDRQNLDSYTRNQLEIVDTDSDGLLAVALG